MNLVQRVLTDPVNDLQSNAEHFLSGTDRVRYLDRHVFFDVPDDADLAEEAAIELARLWAAQRRAVEEKYSVRISRPYAIIDDEWLDGDRAAAPPHVFVTFAHQDASPETGQGAARLVDGETGNATLDRLRGRYGASLRTMRLDPSSVTDDARGAWRLEPQD